MSHDHDTAVIAILILITDSQGVLQCDILEHLLDQRAGT